MVSVLKSALNAHKYRTFTSKTWYLSVYFAKVLWSVNIYAYSHLHRNVLIQNISRAIHTIAKRSEAKAHAYLEINAAN